MTDFAELSDVAAVWSDMPDRCNTAVPVAIRSASARLRRLIPRLDARIADGLLDIEVVRTIVVDMVRRYLGDKVKRERVEDAEWEFDTSDMRLGLQPTQDELDLLAPAGDVPASGKRPSAYGSIRPRIGMAP